MLGTWDYIFKQGLEAPVGTPLAYAILSLKEELGFNGIDVSTLNMESPRIGLGTADRIKRFQVAHNLYADGQAGPNTLKVLLRKRCNAAEHTYGLEPMIIAKMVELESSDDLNCTSIDLHDRGTCQINSIAHPQVVNSQAYNAKFSIDWMGRYERDALARFHDVDVAIAAYNVGFGGADKWQKAGKPKLWLENGVWVRPTADLYVAVVRKRTG